MGTMILDKVMQLLNAGGIRAEAAYPGERITRVTEPVAAVSLEKADHKSHTVTALVEILGPKESGGYLCQKKALEACAILEEAGAVCCQEGCDFLSKGNVFRVPVKATFRGTARADEMEEMPKYQIVTGALTLDYACGFSSQQKKGSTGTLEEAPWEFTVEEFFPWGVHDTLGVEEPFTLELRDQGHMERYATCEWTSRKRVTEELGIRQTRTGKAKSRALTSY